MAPFDRPYTTFYCPAIVLGIALSCTIFELFGVEKNRDLENWLEVTESHLKWHHSKAWVRFHFVFAFKSNYDFNLHHFGDISRKSRLFETALHSTPPFGGRVPVGILS